MRNLVACLVTLALAGCVTAQPNSYEQAQAYCQIYLGMTPQHDNCIAGWEYAQQQQVAQSTGQLNMVLGTIFVGLAAAADIAADIAVTQRR